MRDGPNWAHAIIAALVIVMAYFVAVGSATGAVAAMIGAFLVIPVAERFFGL